MDPHTPSTISFVPESPPNGPVQQPEIPQAPIIPVKKPFPFVNIFLISGVILFIMSIGFYLQTQRAVVTSQASLPVPESIIPTAIPPIETPLNTFPTTYKEETIPQVLYTSAQSEIPQDQVNKDIYIQSMIMKFYVYRDVLTGEDPAFQAPVPDNFPSLVSTVTDMEKKLSDTVLAKADYGYITAPIADAHDPSSKYTAQTLLEGYRKPLLSKEFTIEQMVAVAAQDETLVSLGKEKVGGMLTGYDSTHALFPQSAEFDEFLFRQKVNEVSPVYTLKDLQDQDYALVIVYPIRILLNKYTSLFKILESHQQNFTY